MTRPLEKRVAAFSETMIDGEIVLLNLADGTFFSLTGTAAAIWPLIDGQTGRNGLVATLAQRFEADASQIGRDVDLFLEQLRQAGFLASS